MSDRTLTINNNFFRLVNSPFKFRLFLLTKLPAAFFSGLRIVMADAGRCVVSVRYRWFTRNPFRSTYFASLAMAAELSTGVLVMAQSSNNRRLGMLVVSIQGRFFKKAVGITRFTCEDGDKASAAVEQSGVSGEAVVVNMLSRGVNENNEVVAEFEIAWSVKLKR